MYEKLLDKYADLILETGVKLKEGQNLLIAAEPVHWDFVALLEKKAYERGARYVRPELIHPKSKLARVNYSKKEYLDYIPSYFDKNIDTYVDENWSLISLNGMEEPEIYKEMDQERNSIMQRALLERSMKFSMARIAGNCRWNIAPVPTLKWASQVLGGDTSEQKLEEFWNILIPILKLDQENPIEAWQKHAETLHARRKFLNETNLDYLHFKGEGTDLKIYMNKLGNWMGGAFNSPYDKENFIPNLPTEEVFTSPDFKKTQGKVKVTRPVEVLGNLVKEAWFKFKDGEVVDYGAKEGKELLEKYFSIDPQAKFLGEVALVDSASPIFKANKIFYSILLDENASCHIALGKGFSLCIQNGENMEEQELIDAGCNKSLLHTDFMIGSETIDVTGFLQNGNELPIIENGRFVID